MEKLVLIIFLVSFGIIEVVANGTVDLFTTMCAQTPYPNLCHNSLPVATATATSTAAATVQGANIIPQELTKFNTLNNINYVRHAILDVTLSRAKSVYYFMLNMSSIHYYNHDHNHDLINSAWKDCLELHKDTIEKLNRSITTTTTTLLYDAQTWLSATITNQQTCLNGFLDFNLSYYHDHHQFEEQQEQEQEQELSRITSSYPFSTNDYSKHLRNSLAINKVAINMVKEGQRRRHRRRRRLLDESSGFPEWVSAADRKILLESSSPAGGANIIVAQDGSGHYKTISEAISAGGKVSGGGNRVVVYVKKGVYKENVEIKRSMRKIMLIGDGIDSTIVTDSKNVQDGSTTFRSATFAVMGDGFIAKGMTFENTAGPQKQQAVALCSGSDQSVFYQCNFRGYQDTLYVYSQRQFYRDCNIHGTVDFIFGNAAVVFQNCNIYLRKPMNGQFITVTAQGRTDPNQNTGIIIHDSKIMPSESIPGSVDSYLGRPWEEYSRTVIMKCSIDGVISPAGWLPWNGNFALSTLYYGEYMNSGAGAGTGGRVKWGGFHVINSPVEAGKFSVGNFIGGSGWIPSSGVPFTAGV